MGLGEVQVTVTVTVEGTVTCKVLVTVTVTVTVTITAPPPFLTPCHLHFRGPQPSQYLQLNFFKTYLDFFFSSLGKEENNFFASPTALFNSSRESARFSELYISKLCAAMLLWAG